jgi:hypothetical protein
MVRGRRSCVLDKRQAALFASQVRRATDFGSSNLRIDGQGVDMKRKPLVAGLIAIFVLTAVVSAAVWVRQTSQPAGNPPVQQIFETAWMDPLDTTIELTR